MSSDVSKGKHICSNERHLTLYDAVNFPYSEVNGSKTSNISNNRRGSPEENEGKLMSV
ncbi:unnamed protein product [Schistosoma turkestanicum]|nr:unnamed protein product [Schistosoma turkestanicum]